VTTAATISRKSLLYRSKVEYGGWTVNHVQGCSHGCRFPCYAMMLAKRVGRVAGYDEWVVPRVVGNAMELLEAELARFGDRIDSVHLCFSTDPFMYDALEAGPAGEICDLSRQIIVRLNEAGIPVTTLTKGVYPDELKAGIDGLHAANEYGISLVSLSEPFRAEWEPGAAPVEARIASLRTLAGKGCRTWVSIEPYPTPNIDPGAADVERLLEALSFVDRMVFGKWNYNRLASTYEREYGFYGEIASRVAEWCMRNGKSLHIKSGTPLAGTAGRDALACPA
jgi:DNA repair photolyase